MGGGERVNASAAPSGKLSIDARDQLSCVARAPIGAAGALLLASWQMAPSLGPAANWRADHASAGAQGNTGPIIPIAGRFVRACACAKQRRQCKLVDLTPQQSGKRSTSGQASRAEASGPLPVWTELKGGRQVSGFVGVSVGLGFA